LSLNALYVVFSCIPKNKYNFFGTQNRTGRTPTKYYGKAIQFSEYNSNTIIEALIKDVKQHKNRDRNIEG